MLTIGDAIRWQMEASSPWYAVVIGHPPGAMSGFVVAADDRRAAVVHAHDCLVIRSDADSLATAEALRGAYLAKHPGGLA